MSRSGFWTWVVPVLIVGAWLAVIAVLIEWTR